MSIDKLRYELTDHIEKIAIFTCENFMLLVHPSINKYGDFVERIKEDISLMPCITHTKDKINVKFYKFDYNNDIYNKDELLSFIFASINKEWNISKGINIKTGKIRYWLEQDDIVFDPALAIITRKKFYNKYFKQIKQIANKDISNYLEKNNNLYKFYKSNSFNKNIDANFSVDFINNIIKEFNENVESQYILNENTMEEIKKHIWWDDFIRFRQVLTHKRKYEIDSSEISIHPLLDKSILNEIDMTANQIKELMLKEYNMDFDYYKKTIGNCYALSILFNLYNKDYKLVQGGIPYNNGCFYQHSWLEKNDIVYDPAFKMIVPKDLYYIFVEKQDEYTKAETENILRRIGFNLTHFRDFMNGVQVGNDETIRYRSLVKEIDSSKNKEEGDKLIKLVKNYKEKSH